VSASGTGVDIDGHRVNLTNLDKVLYPASGFTKAEVVDYYARIAPVLLPHLFGRHLTLKRFPDGVDGTSFFEKRCPSHRPAWVRTVAVARSSGRGRGRSGAEEEPITFCTAADTATLVWLANLAAIELHAPMALAAAPDQPTAVVFDLDPGAPADLVSCCEIALWLRDALGRLGLGCWPKTSGSKGLQIYVPLNTPTTHEASSAFARAMARALERERPEQVVSTQRKDARVGRVLIDWSQNSWHKTTISVYSLRARTRPTVSTPVDWDEVDQVALSGDGTSLVFEAQAVLDRVATNGDLFAPVLRERQELPLLPAARQR
jgi:bifunctional non-homologous end joining protein LigD